MKARKSETENARMHGVFASVLAMA